MKKLISVIIPFYYGNEYINRALDSIENVADTVNDVADIEVIIVNDSPEEKIQHEKTCLNCKIVSNKVNSGIHKSRINGLKASKGDYIQYLDQDDELISEGYRKQLELLNNADIAVGNGYYSMGEKNHIIYMSYASMKYLIRFDRMIKIRNLIPSPGECLIKRSAIPEIWINNPLSIDGADDWMLWVSAFKQNTEYAMNPFSVYRHNDTNGANCSADLDKMRNSALEAKEILFKNGIITSQEAKSWEKAIRFKNLQDKGELNIGYILKYNKTIFDNICYKISLLLTDRLK